MDVQHDNNEEMLSRNNGMTNKDDNKLKLPPEAAQSSYERVLEWNNQTQREDFTSVEQNALKRRPGSVPNEGHDPDRLGSLRDDMALSYSNDTFDMVGDLEPLVQWGGNGAPEDMEQSKTNFVSIDEIPYPHDIFLDEPMSVISDDTEGSVFASYLKCHTCYDIVPKSAKIVIFDTRLLVKKAFYALVANGVRSAPLWDNAKQDYVGMLTISDFINILVSYYKSPLVQMEEVEEHRIETWRELSKHELPSSLIQISPFQSLYEACELLIKHKIHRLPVIDPSSSNFLFVISHKRVLHYLHEHFSEMVMPDFMYKTLGDLGIGTLCKIATISPETPIITALNMFAEYKVSALPIVDKDGVVVDIYARFDVINLAAEKSYNNLDVPVIEALKHRAEGFEGVHRCRLNEPLHAVVERIVKAGVHRLVVVDKEDHVVGVMSLSDLLQVLVLHPPGVICGAEDG